MLKHMKDNTAQKIRSELVNEYKKLTGNIDESILDSDQLRRRIDDVKIKKVVNAFEPLTNVSEIVAKEYLAQEGYPCFMLVVVEESIARVVYVKCDHVQNYLLTKINICNITYLTITYVDKYIPTS